MSVHCDLEKVGAGARTRSSWLCIYLVHSLSVCYVLDTALVVSCCLPGACCGVGWAQTHCPGGGVVSGRAAALRVVSVMQGQKSVLDPLLIGGPVYICRLRDHRQEQHPGCPESFRVLGLVQHPSISPEYSPHGHQQHRAGTGKAGGT